jgi:hypothetical protein
VFRVETPLKHLVTVRWSDMRTVAEAEEFRGAIREATMRARPAALCADWRSGTILLQPVAAVLIEMFRHANPNLRRAAILLPDTSPTFAMQAERMVREANNPDRRTFRDPKEHLAWFAEIATPEELLAATRFVNNAG